MFRNESLPVNLMKKLRNTKPSRQKMKYLKEKSLELLEASLDISDSELSANKLIRTNERKKYLVDFASSETKKEKFKMKSGLTTPGVEKEPDFERDDTAFKTEKKNMEARVLTKSAVHPKEGLSSSKGIQIT